VLELHQQTCFKRFVYSNQESWLFTFVSSWHWLYALIDVAVVLGRETADMETDDSFNSCVVMLKMVQVQQSCK